MFGSPETTTGGNALKFYASLRMDIRRIAAIKNGDDGVGNRTKVKVVKSKVAPPFKITEFDILYNEGISKAGELIDLGVNHGLIKKSGAWFTYGEDRFQGREGFRNNLNENEELLNSLDREVREKLGLIKAKPKEEEKETEAKSKKK